VWRINEERDSAFQVGRYLATLDIPRNPSTFQCEDLEMSKDDYINVTEGDFVGVTQFEDGVLPVVGNHIVQAGPQLLFRQFEAAVLNISSQRPSTRSSNAIHVLAHIGKLIYSHDNLLHEWGKGNYK